ncbi:hypothetical protein CPB83DRAFT_645205 [Crepidotus variabilis]|uniref:NACHT domain-containing protein n=1 Tax=Crepidotus variabilis TaxID=179855 RepID=A0A9P6E7X8_9AGAR|nr:hypothetical protein CPB83DRAFT_645205 [Crepidotus variabilis]
MSRYAGRGHQDLSTCLEGTRATTLQELDVWRRKNKHEQGSKMMWLTGSAGSGKTAIAQTVCQRFREEGFFVVDCSFFRSTGRTDPRYLFLSIAYQLAVANPLLKSFIEAVVQADPVIVDAPMDIQLERLIVGPITGAEGHLPTIFVIIDGLDESDGESQQILILRLLQSTIQDHRLPTRILIASRPESWIQNTLLSPPSPPISTITLNQNTEADRDIRAFYNSEFRKIRHDAEHFHSMNSVPTPWPSDTELDELVWRASGQFIYAKTVTRFVSEPGHSPLDRLKLILHPLSESTEQLSPLGQLDALYINILSSVADWNLTSSFLGALAVFRSFKKRREALPIIEGLLDLKPGDAHRALRNLHPLVFVPRDLAPVRERMSHEEYRALLCDKSQHFLFYHKSFIDFLHDPARAREYCVDIPEIHRRMAMGCLNILQNVTSTSPTRLFSVTWLYAVDLWDFHCRYSGNRCNEQLFRTLEQFSLTSWYFMVRKTEDEETWKKLTALRQMEKCDNRALEAIQEVKKILASVNLPFLVQFNATGMQNWVGQQSDIALLNFPKCRLKFWILHKMAAKDGRV